MTHVRDIVNLGCRSFQLYFSLKKEWNNIAIVGLQTIGGSSQSRLSWSNSNDRCTRKSTGNRGQPRVTTNWVTNVKINLLTIIWLPVVTRSYSWLLARKLHLSALNNRYFKQNWKKEETTLHNIIKMRHYVIKVFFGLRTLVFIGLAIVYQRSWYHFCITLTCLKHSVHSILFSRQSYIGSLVFLCFWALYHKFSMFY